MFLTRDDVSEPLSPASDSASRKKARPFAKSQLQVSSLLAIVMPASQNLPLEGFAETVFPLPTGDMSFAPGGTFFMGSDPYWEEAPVHSTTIEGSWIDRFTVTNEPFDR